MSDLNSRVEGWGTQFGAHPVRFAFKALAWLALFVAVIVIVGGVIGLALGWFNAGKDVVGPANVKAQYRAVIEDWQGMEAAAANACEAAKQARESGDPTLVENPALAYDAQYRRIVVDYNRRWANIFEAKAVGPNGYPSVAPTLKRMEGRVCR